MFKKKILSTLLAVGLSASFLVGCGASGDIGDLSYLLPTVQIGVSGFAGRVHGNDFRTEDTYIAYDLPISYFIETVKDLLKEDGKRTKEILSNYKPKLTFDEYIKLLNDTNKTNVYNVED